MTDGLTIKGEDTRYSLKEWDNFSKLEKKNIIRNIKEMGLNKNE